MRITLATDAGDLHTVEVGPSMTVADLAALAASSFRTMQAAGTARLFLNGQELTVPTASLSQAGIIADEVLVVRPAAGAAIARPAAGGRPMAPGGIPTNLTPAQMQAAMGQFLAQMQQQMMAGNPDLQAQLERQRAEQDKQRKIDENLALAMEHTPEAFGQVIMLYIDGKVNGHPLKLFVDSGAQSTIMSKPMAEACGLADLIDTRFAGTAVGVGSAKILGRVHAAELVVGSPDKPLYLMCSFTVLDGDKHSVDLLFGLDMLKRHQACLDFRANCMRIQGIDIPFLSEHELPKKGKEFGGDFAEDKAAAEAAAASAAASPAAAAASAAVAAAASPAAASSAAAGAAAAARAAASSPRSPPVGAAAPAHPASPSPARIAVPPAAGAAAPGTPTAVNQAALDQLVGMGASRTEAIHALQLANGDVNMAASFLFS
ncbi:DNA damage-inducible protein 1 [Blastocladiella emersonii ATCC 22665]|nr:DNA damage-inducible protein 1 [Blastocladiella emersonii ATCC 22665]